MKSGCHSIGVVLLIVGSSALLGLSGKAQTKNIIASYGPLKVAAGEQIFVHRTAPAFYRYSNCPYGSYRCEYLLDGVICSDLSNYISNGVLIDPDITLFPSDSEMRFDTILAAYRSTPTWDTARCFMWCSNYTPNDHETHQYVAVQWSSYWDSIVKIRPKSDSIYIEATPSHLYSHSSRTYLLYNNIDDSVTFAGWHLDLVPPLEVSVSIRQDTVLSDTVLTMPVSHLRNIDAEFGTNVATSIFERRFTGFLRTRVRSSNFDSIYSMPLILVLAADPSNSVQAQTTTQRLLDVGPNPSNGHLTISSFVDEGASATIEVFDDLGRKVQTVFQGIVNVTPNVAQVHLESGTYFIRMQSGSLVVTKRVVVTR